MMKIGKGKKNPVSATEALTISPAQLSSPVQPGTLQIILSGFTPGDFVQTIVPWFEGNFLTYADFIGPNGGYATPGYDPIMAPPDWAVLLLSPGPQVVETRIYPGGDFEQPFVVGPTGTFEIT